MTIIAFEVAAVLILFLTLRRNFLAYQIGLLISFLYTLMLDGNLDVTLPIYILATCVPYIGRLRLSRFSIWLYGVYAGYVIIGVIAQNTVGALTTFLSRLFQFLVFFIVLESNINIEFGKHNICRSVQRAINILLVCESLMGIYLLANGDQFSGNGMVRLVANAQPITGNIAIVGLLLIIWLYFHPKTTYQTKTKLFLSSLLFLFWIILSGTRGYLLLFFFSMLIMYIDYLICYRANKKIFIRTNILLVHIAAVLVLIVVMLNSSIVDKLVSILRLEDSVGIRTYENALVMDYYKNAPILNQIFGIGIGGTGGDYTAYVEALSTQASRGMWHIPEYYNNVGAPFHNLYASILLMQGGLGIGMLIGVVYKIIRAICTTFSNNFALRLSLILYVIGFILMNYYRWSAACGIPEMIVLAYIIKVQRRTDETLLQ